MAYLKVKHLHHQWVHFINPSITKINQQREGFQLICALHGNLTRVFYQRVKSVINGINANIVVENTQDLYVEINKPGIRLGKGYTRETSEKDVK